MRGTFLRSQLEPYLRSPTLAPRRAVAALRAVYLVAFGAQTAVAFVLGIGLRLLIRPDRPGNGVLGWVLVATLLAVLASGTRLSLSLGRRGGRSGALASTLALGVVLATPAWFSSLALLTAQPLGPSLALLACLLFGYALGLLLTARLATRASASEPEPAPRREAEPPRDGPGGEDKA